MARTARVCQADNVSDPDAPAAPGVSKAHVAMDVNDFDDEEGADDDNDPEDDPKDDDSSVALPSNAVSSSETSMRPPLALTRRPLMPYTLMKA
jgi:hypothetical protein